MKIRLLLAAFACLVAITCHASANVSITTTTLPNGTVGTPYSSTVLASGGCSPYSWSTGVLPSGLVSQVSTDTRSLVLVGTPSTAGTYNFGISVTGCGRHVATVNYSVTIQVLAMHIVNLSWIASVSPNIAGYNVYRSSTTGGPWAKVNLLTGLIASTIYTDATVANGTTYYYVATAVDISNQESAYSIPSAAVVIPQ